MQRRGFSVLELMVGTVIALLIAVPSFRMAVNLTKDWQAMSDDLNEMQAWETALSQVKCEQTESSACTPTFTLMDETGNIVVDAVAPMSPMGWMLRASCQNNLIYLNVERTKPSALTKRLSNIPICSVVP